MIEKLTVKNFAIGGTLVAAGVAGYAVTNGDSSPRQAEAVTVELNDEQLKLAGQLCVNGFNMGTSPADEFDMANVGGVDSLMNNFTELNADGETVPVTPEIFADRMLDEICKKPTVLASITAFMIEPAGLGVNGKISTPDASSLNRAEELTKLYRSNEVAALEAIRTIATVVTADNGAEHVDDFAVIENKGTLITPTRGENQVATGQLETKQITVGDLYSGYLFNYVTDTSEFNEKQKAELDRVKLLVMVSDEGQMVITLWIGDNQVDINFDESPETTTVTPEIAEDQETVDVIINPETGVEVPVTYVQTPNGDVIPVVIDPNTGVQIPVNPTTGEPTGEPVPEGSVPAPTGSGGSGGEPEGSGPSHAGPGTSQPGTVDTIPGTTTGTTPGTNPGTTPGTTPVTTVRPGTTTTVYRPSTTTTTVPHTTTTVPRTTTTTTVRPSTTTTTVYRPSTTTTTVPHTTTTVPRTTTTVPVVDVCPNVPGDQGSVPPGQEIVIIDGKPFCKDIYIAPVTTGNPAP